MGALRVCTKSRGNNQKTKETNLAVRIAACCDDDKKSMLLQAGQDRFESSIFSVPMMSAMLTVQYTTVIREATVNYCRSTCRKFCLSLSVKFFQPMAR